MKKKHINTIMIVIGIVAAVVIGYFVVTKVMHMIVKKEKAEFMRDTVSGFAGDMMSKLRG